MFARQSLVNVTLKIRTKFHSKLLVKYRDILHTVSKNLVSRKTRFKVSERHFSYVSFTYFFLLIYRYYYNKYNNILLLYLLLLLLYRYYYIYYYMSYNSQLN